MQLHPYSQHIPSCQIFLFRAGRAALRLAHHRTTHQLLVLVVSTTTTTISTTSSSTINLRHTRAWMALLLCSAVVSSALARVPLLLPQQLQPLLGAPVAPWLSPRCCQLTMTAPPPPADQGRAARRRRGRAARAARRQKNGPDGERAIARKAHQAASKAAGGTAELARRGHAAAAAAVGGADELARQAGAARVAANPLGSTGVAIQRGIGNAIAAGKYTKYPGVRYRRETGKWRVQFKCQGKLHTVGQCVHLPEFNLLSLRTLTRTDVHWRSSHACLSDATSKMMSHHPLQLPCCGLTSLGAISPPNFCTLVVQ